jgi:hypothetical protein
MTASQANMTASQHDSKRTSTHRRAWDGPPTHHSNSMTTATIATCSDRSSSSSSPTLEVGRCTAQHRPATHATTERADQQPQPRGIYTTVLEGIIERGQTRHDKSGKRTDTTAACSALRCCWNAASARRRMRCTSTPRQPQPLVTHYQIEERSMLQVQHGQQALPGCIATLQGSPSAGLASHTREWRASPRRQRTALLPQAGTHIRR